jgi:aryl-alcohol dehydrogenase-like predicted oxidoreductase
MNMNSKIGLGSVQFGIDYGVSNDHGQTSSEEVENILDYAYKVEINIIDTAASYGNAEQVLGFNDLSRFKIISKFMPQEGSKTISFQLNKSLKDLNVNSLYGYLSHRPLSLIDNPKQWDELLTMKQENKIKKIGFSLNEPSELELLLNRGMSPDLIQVPFNYFDNRFRDYLIELKAKGCEIHTRSSFLQGLFFADVQKLPSFFNEVKNDIAELQSSFGNNLSGVLLKYVLALDYIDVVIMGVNNKKQLRNNLTSMNTTQDIPYVNFNFSDSILMPSNWPKK